jgi:hypothetical protein
MDFAGHMASAAQFARSGLHAFNDRMFLGTTHNLFYPPLEDLLINFIKIVSFQNNIISFKIYLTLVLLTYLLVIFLIGLQFKKKLAFIFYHLSIIILLNINKAAGLDLQGMTIDDLLFIGLSNQFLSGIGFFWICKEIIQESKNAKRNIMFATIFSLLSHIIVGAISFGLTVLFLAFNKKIKNKTKPLIYILGICSFYIVPFLYYKSYLVSSNIFKFQPWIPFTLAIIALVIFYRFIETRIFLVLSVVLFATETIFPKLDLIGIKVPIFHYYRFTIVAYFLLILGISTILNLKESSKKNSLLSLTIGAFFIYNTLNIFSIRTDYFKMPAVKQAELKLNSPIQMDENFGRYLVFSNDKSAGTGIESLLSISSPNYRFTKGLFWESSSTNMIESSFMATFLGPPMVLDYFYLYKYPCEVRRCLMDEHFHLYNIKGIVANFNNLNYVAADEKKCYMDMINQGTDKYNFSPKEKFQYFQNTYYVYQIDAKTEDAKNVLEAVEAISLSRIKVADANLLKASEQVVRTNLNACIGEPQQAMTLYIQAREKAKFEKMQKDNPLANSNQLVSQNIKLTKVSENEYRFGLSNQLSWFALKLSPQPGLILLDHEGKELPTLRGMPYTIGIGKGEMRILFKRTWVMWGSYILSLITLIFYIRRSYFTTTFCRIIRSMASRH